MPIKNLEIVSIEARRFTKMGEQIRNVQISHNSTVTQIVESTPTAAEVSWRFSVNYTGVGVITIEGRILWDGDATALSQKWGAEHQMPDDMAQEVHRAVMSNCIPASVMLARDLHIPPPIPLPQINIGKPPQDKKSGYGVEVA